MKDSHSPFLMDWAVLRCRPVHRDGPAEQTKLLELPVPHTQGGKVLMQALYDRRSSREFSRNGLPTQALSNLLWAAFGVNRPERAAEPPPRPSTGRRSMYTSVLRRGCSSTTPPATSCGSY